MAAAINGSTGKRYAVVTGANKGIGFEICRQLATHGIVVILTARDEKRGLDALERLKGSCDISENVLFHQLDVADSSSVASLAKFIKTQFGKLDVLVNNAGIGGVVFDADGFAAEAAAAETGREVDRRSFLIPTYESAVECLEINFYGAKRMTETFIPLLQLSQSPRIVNVSSSMGQLQNIPNDWARGIFGDIDNLAEERIDEVLNQFLRDFNEGALEAKAWPSFLSAYTVSKAALNAYTRIVAKKYPNLKINCVCPGYVKTDINFNTGILSVEDGAASPVKLALSDDGPSGLFFIRSEVTSFE